MVIVLFRVADEPEPFFEESLHNFFIEAEVPTVLDVFAVGCDSLGLWREFLLYLGIAITWEVSKIAGSNASCFKSDKIDTNSFLIVFYSSIKVP